MKSVIAAALLLGLGQVGSHRVAASTPLDECWLPGLGHVSVTAEGGARFAVSVESDGKSREQAFELDSLPASATVTAAKISTGRFVGTGGVIALAIGQGSSTAYYYLASSKLPARETPLKSSELNDVTQSWWISKPIFKSTGRPYRIVDTHVEGDSIEITFRRGWPNLTMPDGQVDEKVYFDNCGVGETLQPGRAVLFEDAMFRASR
jgi:hypothetical protein